MPIHSVSNFGMQLPTVVVYEANPKVLNYMKRLFASRYRLLLHSRPKDFLHDLETEKQIDLVVFAWDGPDFSLELLGNLRKAQPEVPLLVLTCSAEIADYQAFLKADATSIVLKPFVDDNLHTAIAECLPADRPRNDHVREITLDEGHSFVRSSKRMREIEAQAMLVARSDIPVLILGESGTGKEILALFTHKMSQRSSRMFLKVNCAAMPAELLESELFGYEQGAFTGAVKTKPGKFETCNGGTIFLDEIGEMPAILQAKLLQVLQDGTFSRLGSRAPMRTDVRVIAATNINMKQAMANKSFREDLYYRLNGISLVLPPLRDRLEEIPALVEYFMRKGANKHKVKPQPVSQELLEALCRHEWPGNLRELENVINRYLILQDEKVILCELSPRTESLEVTQSHPLTDRGLKHLVRDMKGEAEAVAINEALQKSHWNRKAAATELQISYKALLYKIKQYDLARSA